MGDSPIPSSAPHGSLGILCHSFPRGRATGPPHRNATVARGAFLAQPPARQVRPLRHPDPQHLAKVLRKSKFAFRASGLRRVQGGMRRPQAGISSPGPPHGTLAPRWVLLPHWDSTHHEQPWHRAALLHEHLPSPAPPVHTDMAWQHSKLSSSFHKSPRNGAETTSKVWGSCRHRLRFWGLGGEAGGFSSGILNMPLLLKQLDEPTVMSLA